MFKSLFSRDKVLHDALGTDLALQSARVITTHEGPALVVDAQARVLNSNPAAAILTMLLDSPEGTGFGETIRKAAANGLSSTERLLVSLNGERAVYQVALVPFLTAENDVRLLILGRDVTVERNLIEALVASRELYKDLVECSSDFAFETDNDGMLTYVSPKGALGFMAAELTGRPARDILHEGNREIEPLPFSSEEDVIDAQVWVIRKDGTEGLMRVSSVPVRDENGFWLGSRGVCRDITAEFERQQALDRGRERERLMLTVVDSIRNEADPKRAMAAAASLAAKSLRASRCWILRFHATGGASIVGRFPNEHGAAQESAIEAALRAANGENEQGLLNVEVAGQPMMVMLSSYRGRHNGAICLLQEVAAKGWGEEDFELTRHLAGHTGIAIEQMADREHLEAISRQDSLTNLANRRAFLDDAEIRLKHHERHQRPAALLYIDLDNFKPINDRYGHEQGDNVLKRFAEILSHGNRTGDLPARLGGDEFALWLEESDVGGAIARANRIRQAVDKVENWSPDPGLRISLSMGIAVLDPLKPERLSELLRRADSAMYEAKRAGRDKIFLDQRGTSVSVAQDGVR